MIIGIVGKPSCGKSTFFNAATLAGAEMAAYPFTTIKPNHAVGFVKINCVDKFFGKQCNPRMGYCINHNRFVPVDLMDVAGLVPGAHEGKGMGNQFLDDLNQANALIHVIDASGSTNEKGEIVSAGSYDPENDIKFLETELDMWYLRLVQKGWERFAKQVQQEHQQVAKALAKHLSGVRVTEEMIKALMKNMSLPEQIEQWDNKILLKVARELRRITKPMIIAANKVDIEQGAVNVRKLRADFPNLTIIACSAESELALRQAAKHGLIEYIPGEKNFNIIKNMNEKQKDALEFIRKNVLDKFLGGTGVQTVLNTAVFGLLKYVAVYPGGVGKLEDSKGNVLPDCFLMPPGTTALDFAFKIHTDIGNKYSKAINVKTKMPMAKDHVLESGDVVEILTQ